LKLTIAIPTFNRAKDLDNCLFELFKSYKRNFNIIVQDNSSNDNTEDVVFKYISMGLPISYSKNSTNLGWAKNFEICFKKTKTEFLILLGDDDIISFRAIDSILDLINSKNPDLIFLKAFSFKKTPKNQNKIVPKFKKCKLEEFLVDTILQFRLISSYVIKTKYISMTNDFTGNFAHLNVIYKVLNYGKTFYVSNSKLIGSKKNNSEFDLGVNFSDIYVKEFFHSYKENLKNKINDSIFEEIEGVMLKKYYPKLIIKSRLGFLPIDTRLEENFNSFFSNNKFYKKYNSFYTRNNFFSWIFLIYLIVFTKIKKK